MLGNLLSSRAQQWLRIGRPATILHLFDEVCNLADDHENVISLVSSHIGPGPFAITLDGDFTAGLDVHDAISIDYEKQTLTVGSLVIDVGEAVVWQSKPDWTRLRDADVTHWPSPAELPSEIDAYLKQTINGIVAQDTATCLAGVTGLAGRGNGLTPTGDDVLLGILYGLWVWYPHRDWMELIAETAVPRTTTLSANFIRVATAGEAVWQWHDLANGRPQAIEKILSIGHTSGADTWAGFVTTCSVFSSGQTPAIN